MAKDDGKALGRLRKLMERKDAAKRKSKPKGKKLRELISRAEKAKPQKKPEPMQVLREVVAKAADEIVIVRGHEARHLVEGKWIGVNFDKEIRVDRNTHMRSADMHAHIHDRKGNELYALTQNGKPSHGSKPFRLDKKQAAELRKQGFTIPKNRIVEAVLIGQFRMIIYG